MRTCSRASPGRVVTGKTAKNVEMYNSYSNYIDAVNGYDLTPDPGQHHPGLCRAGH